MPITIILTLSVLAQSLAALIAFLQIRESGRYQLAWGFVSLALILMVQRRVAPLLRHLDGIEPALTDSLLGLAISLCMLAGLWGIRLLFDDIKQQDTQLAKMASTDPLTGLANRREVRARALLELDRVAREGLPLSLLMLDLDHFKSVNDRWGHAAGDAVLRTVASVFRDELRRIDLPGRYGGEEFLVILPNATSDEALVTAERLRVALAKRRTALTDNEISITASIGCATYYGDTVITLDEFLERVDTALYSAKNLGRNRVIRWAPSTGTDMRIWPQKREKGCETH